MGFINQLTTGGATLWLLSHVDCSCNTWLWYVMICVYLYIPTFLVYTRLYPHAPFIFDTPNQTFGSLAIAIMHYTQLCQSNQLNHVKSSASMFQTHQTPPNQIMPWLSILWTNPFSETVHVWHLTVLHCIMYEKKYIMANLRCPAEKKQSYMVSR